jgi:hypothetical protein
MHTIKFAHNLRNIVGKLGAIGELEFNFKNHDNHTFPNEYFVFHSASQAYIGSAWHGCFGTVQEATVEDINDSAKPLSYGEMPARQDQKT